jgi:glycosyltransferase involved in cell wall biosynthesis
MHIVHVGTRYEAETTNGVRRAVASYVDGQLALGHRVTMVRLMREKTTDWERNPNIDHYELFVPALNPFRLGSEAARFFRENLPGGDVYHFHNSHSRLCLAARLLDVPYVFSPHGSYLIQAQRLRTQRNFIFRLLLGRPFIRGAAFVHTLTSEEAAAIERYAGPVPMRRIPNALKPALAYDVEARRRTRAALGLGDDVLLVAFLGRLDIRGKGLDVLVEGFRQACVLAPERRIVLSLYGTGLVKRVEALVPPEVSDRVSVQPAILGDEKAALLSAADVFVTLSRWDVMPTALMDALSAGLPIIVTEATGMDEFVRAHDAGRVVDLDPADVARAIASYDARALLPGREERARVAEREFSANRVARAFVRLYEDALGLPAQSAARS